MDIYPDVTVAALAPKVIDTKDAFINMGDNQSSSSPSMTQITLALKGLKQLPESGVIDVKLTLTIAPEVSAAAKRATINNQERHRPSGSLISSHASKVVAKTIEVKVVGRVVDLATAKEIEGLAAAGGTSNMQGSPNQVGIPTHALDRLSPHTLSINYHKPNNSSRSNALAIRVSNLIALSTCLRLPPPESYRQHRHDG